MLLATEPPRGLSARNVLASRILDLAPGPAGSVNVSLRLDGGPDLIAAVTPDAVEALSLTAGLRVWAVIKSLAVDDGAMGRSGSAER